MNDYNYAEALYCSSLQIHLTSESQFSPRRKHKFLWGCISKDTRHINLPNQTYRPTHCGDLLGVGEQPKVAFHCNIIVCKLVYCPGLCIQITPNTVQIRVHRLKPHYSLLLHCDCPEPFAPACSDDLEEETFSPANTAALLRIGLPKNDVFVFSPHPINRQLANTRCRFLLYAN